MIKNHHCRGSLSPHHSTFVFSLYIIAIVLLSIISHSNHQVNGELIEYSVKGLHVEGKFIKNGKGEVIQLRGANRPGTEYCCVQYGKIFDGPSDMDHLKEMVNWNINAVRVPLNEDCWLGLHAKESDHFGAAYRKAITQYINDITSLNIAVIIDLHWAGDGGGSILAEKQIPMPNSVNSPTFWKSVANTFIDNTAVLFDLYNEPYPYGNDWDSENAWKCWRDGVDCGDTITYKPAGMQQLVSAVRSTGSKNIVILSGIQYATSLTKFLQYIPVDPINQMGAAIHSYDFNFCRSRGCWDTYLRPVFEKYPIVATETGQRDCKTDFIRDFLHYCDQNDIHYLAWSWLVAPCDNPSLITDYDGTPTVYGRGLKLHLNALANNEEPFYSDTFDMFNDKFTHWVDNWSTDKAMLSNSSDVVHEGEYAIFYHPETDQTLHLRCWGCVQTDIHKQVEFWVNGGFQGGQQLDLCLLQLNEDGSNTVMQTFSLDSLLGQSIPADKWVKVIADLGALPKGTQYDGIWLKPPNATYQSPLFVDKVTIRAYIDPPMPAEWQDQSEESSSSKLIIMTQKLFFTTIILLSYFLLF
ncbi:galactose-binding domain-containing protein [Cavenderia fasciculata]|uniref:Galactose-binding domain-containing protein n=1 Tax=Cavenderia fasciculata TaxID=261658 RepID=F4PPY1_CACFS|nr:galactose-binding domain-containing protein [Cavenderia fasciculata]EGG22444.1 galactose-binding domain-containing protein [Cavenderia fasciculata]|eukprot:XP_004360295.1 galactose-binding domain-containing protein [Cavenderia fasciculata]